MCMCIWSHGSHAHGRASAHLNDAVQGVAAKVVVGPLVAVCSGSDAATCEGEGSAAQHGRLAAKDTLATRARATSVSRQAGYLFCLVALSLSPDTKSCKRSVS